jgi:hypothetical protein
MLLTLMINLGMFTPPTPVGRGSGGTSRIVQYEKEAATTLRLEFSFLGRTLVTDQIVSAVCTPSMLSGGETVPVLTMVGSAAVVQKMVSQVVGAGTPGCSYKVNCVATLQDGTLVAILSYVVVH